MVGNQRKEAREGAGPKSSRVISIRHGNALKAVDSMTISPFRDGCELLLEVLIMFSRGVGYFRLLFQPPQQELTDEEIAAVLRQSIAGSGRFPEIWMSSLPGSVRSIWLTGCAPRALSWPVQCGGVCIPNR
jgi:hypothetical protein